jgi:hypothetical protein
MDESSIVEPPLEILLLPDRRGYRLVAPRYADADRPDNGRVVADQMESASPGRLRRAARAIRRVYQRVTHKRAVREELLRELREDSQLIVRYPAELGVEGAKARLRHLLESYRRKHRRWMIANGALLPLGAVLTLVPGPNVFAAYMAWRTLAHHRAGRGTRAALGLSDVRFEADEVLDRLAAVRRARFRPGRRRRTRALGMILGVPRLDRLY